jgi:large subunit ribosomal protein L7/L12
MSNKSINIANEIKNLSVNEIKELINEIEKFLGIKINLVVESFNAVPNAEQDKKNSKVEQTEFNLILEEVPADKKIAILKVIRSLTNLGLKEVKELVESAPKIVKENLTKEIAEINKKQIEDAGGRASLK